MIGAWRAVWESKGTNAVALAGGEDEVLRELLRRGGYDSPTATLGLDAFRSLMDYVAALVQLGTNDSLYEVGCGAGAVLRTLGRRCASVGGLDYARSQAEAAALVTGSPDIAWLEADELPIVPRYDVVLSVGAFLYFQDSAYAERVLRRMVEKARRAVAVIDVNDAGRRELALALRRRAGAPPLPQLFLARSFFEDFATRHGLRIRIDECTVTGSANSRYRYNVLLGGANGGDGRGART